MKNLYKVLALIITGVMVLSICGCSNSGTGNTGKISTPPQSKESKILTSQERELPENLMKYIKPENVDLGNGKTENTGKALAEEFSVSLFQKVIDSSLEKCTVGESDESLPDSLSDVMIGNVLVSPLSVSFALGMTANGANGNTLEEMEEAFGGIPVSMFNKYLGSYLNDCRTDDKSKIKFANSIWFEKDFNVNKSFLQTNANYYNADIYKEDFNNGNIEDLINGWVKSNTDNMIDKIVDKVDNRSIMYLINALTFESEWENVYTDTNVRDDYFRNLYGFRKSVQMMQSEEYKYISDDKSKGFIKDYKGGKYSFAAILPKDDISIIEYINSLNDKDLFSAIKNAEEVPVMVSIPKFSYDYEIDLKAALQSMGMQCAFDKNMADFSRMGESAIGNAYISKVLHKTHIEVGEKGTRAGAATSVEIKTELASEQEVKRVTLNRPFVYIIMDNEENLPVFMGMLADVVGDADCTYED